MQPQMPNISAARRRAGVPLLQCGKIIVLTRPERAGHADTILQRAAAAGAELHDISKQAPAPSCTGSAAQPHLS